MENDLEVKIAVLDLLQQLTQDSGVSSQFDLHYLSVSRHRFTRGLKTRLFARDYCSAKLRNNRAYADLTENALTGSLCCLGRVENLLFGTSQLFVHWQTLMLPQLPEKLV